MIDKTQTDQIAHYCEQDEEIVAVYLFGSRAGNDYTSQSDVDLAVLLKSEESSFDLLGFIVTMERMLKLPVDAVVLNRAGEVLKYQVRLHSVLLYESDAKLRKQFEIMGRKSYEDFQYFHRRYIRRTLYGELNG
jgi:predicted nucleotidyltransferase